MVVRGLRRGAYSFRHPERDLSEIDNCYHGYKRAIRRVAARPSLKTSVREKEQLAILFEKQANTEIFLLLEVANQAREHHNFVLNLLI